MPSATTQNAAGDKFSESKKRKIMQDKLTTQKEEIQLLRAELSRLRERTFPSFVQAHDDNIEVADQRKE